MEIYERQAAENSGDGMRRCQRIISLQDIQDAEKDANDKKEY